MKLSIIFQTLCFCLLVIFMLFLPLVRRTRAERTGRNFFNVSTTPCNGLQPPPKLELFKKPKKYAGFPITVPQVKLSIRCSANYSVKVGLYNSAVIHGNRSRFPDRLEPLGKFIRSDKISMSPLTRLEVALLLREGDHLVLCYSAECNQYQTGLRIDYHNFTLKFSKNKAKSSLDMHKNLEGSALMLTLLLVYAPPLRNALVILLLVAWSLLAVRQCHKRRRQLPNESTGETSL